MPVFRRIYFQHYDEYVSSQLALPAKQFLRIYPLEAVTRDESIGGKRDSRYFFLQKKKRKEKKRKIATRVKLVADAAISSTPSLSLSLSLD